MLRGQSQDRSHAGSTYLLSEDHVCSGSIDRRIGMRGLPLSGQKGRRGRFRDS